jgi:hypothetical protein
MIPSNNTMKQVKVNEGACHPPSDGGRTWVA